MYDDIWEGNFFLEGEIANWTKYLVHCQTGYRSMIASSILRNYDFDVVEIKDGLQGFIKSNSKELIIY